MLVLHHHKLIFIRTRKTAGTSVEIALSRHAGDGDIITPLCARDEELRAAEGGRGPQHHLQPGHRPLGPPEPGPGPGVRFYNHVPAWDVARELGPDIWRAYTTVCLERHPFEKVVSLYFHRHRTEPRRPLEEFITSGEFRDAFNWPLYTGPDNSVIVDRVIDHSHLQQGLDDLCEQLGLPRLRLPRAKAHFRPTDTLPQRLLSRRARAAIEDAYAAEFTHHGYA